MLPTKSPAILTAILASALFITDQPGAAAQAGAADQPHTITMVTLQTTLDKAVDAKKSKPGDPVTVKITGAATLNDGTPIPAGSTLSGKIDSVTPSEKKGDSTVVLTLDKLQIKNGKEIGVKATVMQVSSLVPDYGSDQAAPDPSSYRPGTAGNSGQNNSTSPQGPHPIAGLTLTGTSHDPTSATLTQAKKNVHLPSGALLQVSVAVIPPGVTLQ
jgi:hypothetical protein